MLFIHKRRHHRRPKPARDPQQIKELRLIRLNIKRQNCWDTRFIKDTIPDLFARKPKRKKIEGRTPLETAYVDKEWSRLPNVQKDRMRDTISTNKRKSFKIRPLRKQVRNQEKTVGEGNTIEVEKQGKKMSRRENNKERLINKLQQKQKSNAINPKYKQLLTDLILRSTQKRHKLIRSTLHKEIDSIGTDQNAYKKLENMTQKRKVMLKNIKQSNQTATLQSYIDLQVHSLLLIEQILKFKAFWESIYRDGLKHPTRVNFYYQEQSYLPTINQEVQGFAEKDPFLVERTAKLREKANPAAGEEEMQERKEMMLKIRACQLLLIEEELLTAQ